MHILRLFMLSWYLILNLGMSVHLHYCMGRLKKVEVLLSQTSTCVCATDEFKPACCEDEYISLSVDEPHIIGQAEQVVFPIIYADYTPVLSSLDRTGRHTLPSLRLEAEGPPPWPLPAYLLLQAPLYYG